MDSKLTYQHHLLTDMLFKQMQKNINAMKSVVSFPMSELVFFQTQLQHLKIQTSIMHEIYFFMVDLLREMQYLLVKE